MDISQLPKLGKVAGVPGIALGAVVLLLGAVLAGTDALPDGWRGPVAIAVVVGVILLALLTIHSYRGGAQIASTHGDHSPAGNIDRTKAGGGQSASTTGANSPASNVRE